MVPASLGPRPCFPNKFLSDTNALPGQMAESLIPGITDHLVPPCQLSSWLEKDSVKIWANQRLKDEDQNNTDKCGLYIFSNSQLPSQCFGVFFLSPRDINYSLFNSCPKPSLLLFTLIDVNHYTLVLAALTYTTHFKKVLSVISLNPHNNQGLLLGHTCKAAKGRKTGGSDHWHLH